MDSPPQRPLASARRWFAGHRTFVWTTLVIGSALPILVFLWTGLPAPELVGVLLGIASWTCAMLAFDSWLIRSGHTAFAALLLKGVIAQFGLSVILAACTQGVGLLIIYGPTLLLATPLLDVGLAIDREGTASWLRALPATFGITIVCGFGHFGTAIVLASAISAGSLPRSVVGRRRRRSGRHGNAVEPTARVQPPARTNLD